MLIWLSCVRMLRDCSSVGCSAKKSPHPVMAARQQQVRTGIAALQNRLVLITFPPHSQGPAASSLARQETDPSVVACFEQPTRSIIPAGNTRSSRREAMLPTQPSLFTQLQSRRKHNLLKLQLSSSFTHNVQEYLANSSYLLHVYPYHTANSPAGAQKK